MKKNFFTILLLASFASEARAFSSNIYQADSPPGFQKVQLAVYYETLCPYCAKFIAERLGDVLFNKGLISIVDLQLVPWGNAAVLLNGTTTCQHGGDECELNKLEACVIELWPRVVDHFIYIQCIEQKLISGTDIKSCFRKVEDWQAVQRCYVTIGEQLELRHKAKTDSLKPPHTFVPWVVVNNQPILQDYGNFIKYVCKAYRGPPPEACRPVALHVDEEKKGKLESQVCYAMSDAKQTSHEEIKILGR